MYILQGTAVDSTGATTTYNIQLQSDGTSTPEQTQTNLFFGFVLFFIVAGGIILYFQRRFK